MTICNESHSGSLKRSNNNFILCSLYTHCVEHMEMDGMFYLHLILLDSLRCLGHKCWFYILSFASIV